MFDRFKLEIVLALVGLFLVGCGVFVYKMGEISTDSIEIISSSEVLGETTQNKLLIDVAGAVVKPGVYEIAQNGRYGMALEAAGGLAEGADQDFVAKNLNMAEKVKDGQKIYIPYKNDQTLNSNDQVNSNHQNSNKININSASQSELESLSGIGPATAKKVIENRPYSDIKDLVDKKVLGQKVFDQISDQISLW